MSKANYSGVKFRAPRHPPKRWSFVVFWNYFFISVKIGNLFSSLRRKYLNFATKTVNFYRKLFYFIISAINSPYHICPYFPRIDNEVLRSFPTLPKIKKIIKTEVMPIKSRPTLVVLWIMLFVESFSSLITLSTNAVLLNFKD